MFELFESCVSPVFQQAFQGLLPLLFISLGFGELLQQGITGKSGNFLCLASGIAIITSLVDLHEATGCTLFFMLTYPGVWLAKKFRSMVVFMLFLGSGLMYFIFREYVPFDESNSWAQVRGIMMIGFMKASSLAYELSSKQRGESPSAGNYFGYLFYPGTIAFGPWISYSDHLSLLNLFLQRSNYKIWLIEAAKNLAYAFAYLLLSTCIFQWLFMDYDEKYVLLLRDALMVRFSHYFICQLSQAICILNGPRSGVEVLSCPVFKPLHVEMPRSLVDAVVCWNIPMHQWLKKHIYNPLAHFGKIRAALATFLISAMLHGLNFGLSAVLLSLAIYCYIEYNFRQLLSDTLSCCIGVRPCYSRCTHKYRNQLSVHLINFGFSLLAVFNLAYLGVMLESPSSVENEGTLIGKVSQLLFRWNELQYSSHIIMYTILTFTFISRFFLRMF